MERMVRQFVIVSVDIWLPALAPKMPPSKRARRGGVERRTYRNATSKVISGPNSFLFKFGLYVRTVPYFTIVRYNSSRIKKDLSCFLRSQFSTPLTRPAKNIYSAVPRPIFSASVRKHRIPELEGERIPEPILIRPILRFPRKMSLAAPFPADGIGEEECLLAI